MLNKSKTPANKSWLKLNFVCNREFEIATLHEINVYKRVGSHLTELITMSAGSIAQAENAPLSQSWVAHHPRWVVGWMTLVMTGGALCVGLGALNWAGLLFLLYAVQGLIAECLGVRVSADHISAPRRVRFLPPMFVFWRVKASLDNIQDITSISEGLQSEVVVHLKWLSGGALELIFSSRDKKLRFFRALRERRPRLSIYKASQLRAGQYACR